MVNFEKEKQLLQKAEVLLKEGKTDEVIKIFKKLYKENITWMHAHILTESNPEYSLYSKELNKLFEKYYIDVLTNKIFNKYD